MTSHRCSSCDELRVDIAVMARERADMLQTISTLYAQNIEYEQQLNAMRRKIQTGDRVTLKVPSDSVSSTAGIVQFVEPTYEKVWVLHGSDTCPTHYHPSELVVLGINNVDTN